MTTAQKIAELTAQIGMMRLNGDARYWDLRRTYGDDAREVLLYLRTCAEHLGCRKDR